MNENTNEVMVNEERNNENEESMYVEPRESSLGTAAAMLIGAGLTAGTIVAVKFGGKFVKKVAKKLKKNSEDEMDSENVIDITDFSEVTEETEEEK